MGWEWFDNVVAECNTRCNEMLNKAYQDHNETIVKIIEEGGKAQEGFNIFMNNVSTSCENTGAFFNNVVLNMKNSQKDKEFNAEEITQLGLDVDKLLEEYKIKKSYSEEVSRKVIHCKELIEDEKIKIRQDMNGLFDHKKLITWSSAGGSIFSSILSIGFSGGILALGIFGGGLIVGSILSVVELFKKKKLVQLSNLLDELLKKLDVLELKNDKCQENINDITNDIEKYAVKVDKCIKYSSDGSEKTNSNEARVTVMTGNMIGMTEKLQEKFKQVEYEAAANASSSNKILLM